MTRRPHLWKDSQVPNAFPRDLLAGAKTAASFFSAAFFGRNDVIYLDDIGVPDIIICDLNAEHLDHMRTIYPSVSAAYAEDCFEVATRLGAEGRTFDVVISDPYTPTIWPVLTGHHEKFAAIPGRTWITGLIGDDLVREGIPITSTASGTGCTPRVGPNSTPCGCPCATPAATAGSTG